MNFKEYLLYFRFIGYFMVCNGSGGSTLFSVFALYRFFMVSHVLKFMLPNIVLNSWFTLSLGIRVNQEILSMRSTHTLTNSANLQLWSVAIIIIILLKTWQSFRVTVLYPMMYYSRNEARQLESLLHLSSLAITWRKCTILIDKWTINDKNYLTIRHKST